MTFLTRWHHSLRYPLGVVLFALMLLGFGSVGVSLFGSRAQAHDTHVANVLGRQRMLSQRMLRRVMADVDGGTRALAAADMTEFDRSLQALRSGGEVRIGGETIPVPPIGRDPEFNTALDRIGEAWDRLREALGPDLLAGEEPVGKPSSAQLEDLSDHLLLELDGALGVHATMVARRVGVLRGAQLAFLFGGGGLLVVAFLLIRFEVVTPVFTLSRTVDRVRRGEVGEPPVIAPRNELADLGAALYEAAARNSAQLRERESLLELSAALLAAETVEAVAGSLFDALRERCAPTVQSFLVPVDGRREMELLASAGEESAHGDLRRISVVDGGSLDRAIRNREVIFESVDRGVRVVMPIAVPGEPASAIVVLDLAVRNGTDEAYLRLAAHLAATAMLRVRHQSARAEAEGRLQKWFDGAPIALYRCAPDGEILGANPAFARLLGYADPEQVVGRRFATFMESESEWEAWRRAVESEGVLAGWESRFACSDGRTIWIRGSARVVKDDRGRLHYECAAEDITEQRAAEESRRESQARFLGIVSLAADAILAVNERQEIVLFNEAAENTFGYEAEEVMGAPLDLLLPTDAREAHRRHFAAFADGPEQARRMGERLQIRARRRDGTEFPAETSISKLEVGGERLYTAVLRDVTDRLDLEERLRESHRAAALGTLAAGTAHFFNNLLTVIRGHTTLLLDSIPEDDASRPDLDSIEDAVSRAAALTRQLLAFTRQQVLAPAVVDTNELISDASPLLKDLLGHEIALDLQLDPRAGAAYIDPDSIAQILVELAVNARDAMPPGGILRIRTRAVHLDEADAAAVGLGAGEFVHLAVADNGIGMPPEVASRAFEPFFTTKEAAKTPGLGLSTVYGILKQSGGAVELKTTPGKGSTFNLYLPKPPLGADASESSSLPALPATERGNSQVILVAEDEASLRVLLQRALERSGYRVLTAADGCEALEIATKADQIDLLVSDVVMPKMNGSAVYSRLVEARPGLPAIFTSGYSEEELTASHSLPPGAPFLPKPFMVADLLGFVTAVLASKDGGGSASDRKKRKSSFMT